MKSQTNLFLSMLVLAMMSLWSAEGIAASTAEVSGVLAPTPVEDHSCIAIGLTVEQGQAIAGLKWYHNDSSVHFPHLLLVEGAPGIAPDLTNTSIVLASLTAEDLSWGEVYLDAPVTSALGFIYAVFEMPAWTEKTGSGSGGGPGLGYREVGAGGRTWLSRDGAQWVRMSPGVQVAVEAIPAGAARSLASPVSMDTAVQSVPEGWWTDVQPTEPKITFVEGVQDGETPGRVSADQPIRVAPNPFNPRTEIWYYVGVRGRVTVSVYDVRGRRVNTLVSATVDPGSHSTVWNGDDHAQSRVASGVYFVRVQTPAGTFQQRVALVR